MRQLLTLLLFALPVMALVQTPAPAQEQAPAQGQATAPAPEALVKRGEYLVNTSACHDCHTPFAMGEAGFGPDMTRALSGHPGELQIAAPARLSAPWAAAVNDTNTAWSGPWGVSFTANLTPDPETGVLRDYDAEKFIALMRTGRHQGQGREILPPMPWQVYGQMQDDELRAIFAYLRSVAPIRNPVPAPLPPAAMN